MGRLPRFTAALGLPAAFAVALLFGTPAYAGDYHESSSLDCAECHVVHTFGSDKQRAGAPQRKSALVGPLLKQDVNDLCLVCHDNSPRGPDVLGRNQGKYPGDVRQAGHLNRLGIDGQPSTGHTLGSLDVAPGSLPPWSADLENGSGIGLTCVNCHAPHGSQGSEAAYRNLRSDTGHNPPGRGLVTYNAGSPGSNDLARDVYVRQALRYDESAVDFNEPDTRESAMGRFCAGCHDNFHGAPGSGSSVGGSRGPDGRYTGFLRHPASGVDLDPGAGGGASLRLYNQHENKVKVMSALGRWDAAGGDATPTCITCHKAHGNDNAFGLIYRSGRGTLTENGDSQGGQVEALCGQCHEQAAFFAR